MKLIEDYISYLMEASRPDAPAWNLEKIREGKKASWNYIDGCMIKAMLELHTITGTNAYLEFAREFIDYYVHEDGSILGYEVEEYNLDHINEGKVLFELYRIYRDEKYKKALDLIYRQIEEQPRTKAGNFWHKEIYPNQVWLDGLYMALPFFVEYDTIFGTCSNYDDILEQIIRVNAIMRDPETGLSYHAYDESREMFWCDSNTGLSKHFWIRAMGWYLMALVDVLEKTDSTKANGKDQKVQEILRASIDAMLRYQHESGMWYQVIDQIGRAGNYLETSGSAIISYAVLKAVRLGYLPGEYRIHGERAFDGICREKLYEKDGHMNLGGICLVAGLGGERMRDGSFEYYLSEPVVENEAKGVAPFLLAYTEIIRYRK